PDLVVACARAGTVAVLRNRAAAPRLRIVDGSGSRVRVVGAPLFQVQVTVEDAEHRTDPTFRGTVRLSSGDPQATLPGDYTFTAADRGAHTFTVALRTPGDQTISARDTAGRLPPDSATVTVAVAADLHFEVEAPEAVTAGRPFNVGVYARDRLDRWVFYTGTVRFTSTDAAATLPGDFAFPDRGEPVPASASYHTFTNGVTLRTPGRCVITVTDRAVPSLCGSVTVTVRPPSP